MLFESTGEGQGELYVSAPTSPIVPPFFVDTDRSLVCDWSAPGLAPHTTMHLALVSNPHSAPRRHEGASGGWAFEGSRRPPHHSGCRSEGPSQAGPEGRLAL